MALSRQTNTVAVSIQDVSFVYGKGQAQKPALDKVSFEVGVGSFHVLMGVNGAGKSTLFSLLSYLFACRQGRIHILGEDINQQPMAALKHIGIVFQQQTLEPGLSVLQNLQYYAALQGLSKLETANRIKQLLALVSLSEQAKQTVSKLSGGQKRRVELARALLHSPDLLLMDEATTGLDVKSRYDFIAMIRKLCAQQNVSVLWATHLVDEVLDSDPVTILHEGKILADSQANEIIEQQGCDSIQAAFLKITGQVDPSKSQTDLSQIMKQQGIDGKSQA